MRTRACWLAIAPLLAAGAFLGFCVLAPWRWRAEIEQFVLSPRLGPALLGDGRPARELLLCYPMGLALDRSGDLLISDRGRYRRGRVVWRIDSAGIAHIVAGSGLEGDATQSRALEMRFSRPEGLAVAADGSLFVSDGFNHSVFRIDGDGRVTRVAGTGSAGFSGDGGNAALAALNRPADLRVDRKGNLFIADVQNERVRKVDPSGRITTVAGTGEAGFSPDGTLAVEARLDTPWGLGIDLQDRLMIADSANQRVRRIDEDGRLVTLAGSGRQGYDGDGGPAIRASLNYPEGLFVEPGGKLFIEDEWNNSVRVVDTDGIISTVIGTGFPGKAMLGGVARISPLDDPENVLATPEGLLITDGWNGRVIRVDNDGIIQHVAGRSDGNDCASFWGSGPQAPTYFR
jgi:sugar lactone lactonase YvrE